MARYSVVEARLYLLPIRLRLPLKFGAQIVTEVTCARVAVTLDRSDGRRTTGWGETPLSVAWVWPDQTLSWDERERQLIDLCRELAHESTAWRDWDHPFAVGQELIHSVERKVSPVPLLARLCCLSAFDLALYDAFGQAEGLPVFSALDVPVPAALGPAFSGKKVADFLRARPSTLPVWHLVGGLDPLEPADLTGAEPDDGYPVLLRDWIRRDGLSCLKIKLRGTDAEWDYERVVQVGKIGADEGVRWLTTDFNCTVTDPAYVCDILDRLKADEPAIHDAILYVEQPFPYELKEHPIDVREVGARKPLLLDESAHDWQHVRLGRELGWTGVALKTCKTLTGALQSLCWAREHGMQLMVQDLTNPMLAQIPHVSLAASAGTMMGVESNGMQFYPAASTPEEAVHPGLFRRRNGLLDLRSLGPAGFGYRVEEIARTLPEPAAVVVR